MNRKNDDRRIQVSFPADFTSNDYMLLEVDEQIVEELEANNKDLYIRGLKSDALVLCARGKTNSCNQIEVSNSLLLLDAFRPVAEENVTVGDFSSKTQILSVTNAFLEVVEITPNMACRINELFSKHQIDFFKNDGDDPVDAANKGITWTQLLSQIQMSEEQLVDELKKYPILQIEGPFYLLAKTTICALLDIVVDICCDQAEQIGGADKLSREMLRSNFPENVPDCAIAWFLREFCLKMDESDFYALDEAKFARARVEQLLRSSNAEQLNFDDFEQRVNNMLPNNCRLREEHLVGLALVNQSHFYAKTIRKLLTTDLPSDLHKRLSTLFTLKPSWKKEEIQPYIVDYCPNPAKVEAFLLGHCRITGGASNRAYVYKQLNF